MILALEIKDQPSQELYTLTPKVMHWCGDIWLFDLSSCSTYWNLRAQHKQTSVEALYEEALRRIYGNKIRAVLAFNPWQALLMLYFMEERHLFGFVQIGSEFGNHLYRDLSWTSWWKACESLALRFSQMKLQHFDLPKFNQSMRLMTKTIMRLNSKNPWAFKHVGALSIRRRFGSQMQELWTWAYEKISRDEQEDGLGLFSEFPWSSFRLFEKPTVLRHLETPLTEWRDMEAFLKEDFEKLCAKVDFCSNHRVVKLALKLTLNDYSELELPISFRYPHAMQIERPHHKTAMLQAYYSFEQTMKQKRCELLSETDSSLVAMLGWEVALEESLVMPIKVIDIFGDHSADEVALMSLENSLPLNLESYYLCNDWLPEDSFLMGRESVKNEASECRKLLKPSLLAVAKERPLFIYKKPLPFLGTASLEKKNNQLLESTMNKWWLRASLENHNKKTLDLIERHYYRFGDQRNQNLWVFKDNADDWYVHGVFA